MGKDNSGGPEGRIPLHPVLCHGLADIRTPHWEGGEVVQESSFIFSPFSVSNASVAVTAKCSMQEVTFLSLKGLYLLMDVFLGENAPQSSLQPPLSKEGMCSESSCKVATL